jgi:hypothetical protein
MSPACWLNVMKMLESDVYLKKLRCGLYTNVGIWFSDNAAGSVTEKLIESAVTASTV